VIKVKVVYLFKKDKVKERVKSPKGTIDSSVIVKLLKKVFPWCKRLDSVVHIADEYYYPVTSGVFDEVRDYASKHGLPIPLSDRYREVVWDCDDFSFYWKGLFHLAGLFKNVNYCFGIVWVYSPTKGYGHALNFYVDDGETFWFYEPQINKSFRERIDDWRLVEVKV